MTRSRATLPSLEFWTTKEIKPFDEEHRDNAWDAMHSFIAAMTWRRSFDSWEVAKRHAATRAGRS